MAEHGRRSPSARLLAMVALALLAAGAGLGGGGATPFPAGAAPTLARPADQAPPDDVQLPVDPDADPDRTRRTADQILSRDEYQAPDTRDRTFVERIREWFGDRVPDLGGDGVEQGTDLASVLVVAVLVLGGAAALAYVLATTRWRRRTPDETSDAEVDLTPLRTSREWDAEAERCAAAGDHRGAVRARFRALSTALARRGLVADTPGRTAGELRADVAERAPEIAAPFGAASDLFEQVWFGDRVAGPAEAASAHDLARATLAAAPRRASSDDAMPTVGAGAEDRT